MIEFYRDEQGVSVVELGILVTMITVIITIIGVGIYVLYCLGVVAGVL